ncbi:MAG: hypothetical protein IT365_08265 [Candidatus Hydrogenedentes bacterium]|nr:hypothetical protein [Candidatus Hydrogenedentota bacterium]
MAILVFLVTDIPYRYADTHAPEGSRFIGQIAMGDDIASYYSFIYQAASGHWVFRNNMTHMDHDPVFVNLELLLLGQCMELFGWSSRTAFDVWRAVGALALFAGFAFLVSLVLESRLQKIAALLMCAFGGGFGWILYLLSLRGIVDISTRLGLKNPAMDLITPIHAFGQVMKNPHFSLPHGVFLVFIGLMVLAERSGKPRWYWSAAIVAAVHGLIRPYDLISIWVFLPCFIILEAFLARSWSIRMSLLRALPLIVTAPFLLYYVYLFTFHPVFKFWASQGVAPSIPMVWHLRAFGLAGVLCLYRLCRYRKYPLSTSGDRLLVIWLLAVLFMFHAYKVLPFIPYSPQLGIPIISAMIALGASVFPPASASPRRVAPAAAVAVFLIVNAFSTPIYVARAAQDAATNDQNYIRTADLDAIDWLNERIHESDLIVSDYPTGTKLARFVGARVLLGHWALTPHRQELSATVDGLLAGDMGFEEAAAFLEDVDATYLYVSRVEGTAPEAYFASIPGLHAEFEIGTVAIYRVDTASGSQMH